MRRRGIENMGSQMFLDKLYTPKTKASQKELSELVVLTWNIRNPSVNRAIQQVDWMVKVCAHIVILTEVKSSRGSEYITDRLASFGYETFSSPLRKNDYGVMIATKDLVSKELELKVNFLPHRVASIICETFIGRVKIIGIYVPSRGPIEKRNVNKRKFQNQFIDLLKSLSHARETKNLIVGGDLNVIERNHIPHHPVFGEWEYKFYESFIKFGLVDAYRFLRPNTMAYSWFGKKGEGYRFDHFFVSKELSRYIGQCSYIHTPRISKLSDHSGMLLKLGHRSLQTS